MNNKDLIEMDLQSSSFWVLHKDENIPAGFNNDVNPLWCLHPISTYNTLEQVSIPVGCFLSASLSPNSAPTGRHRRASRALPVGGDTRSEPGRRRSTSAGAHPEKQRVPGEKVARAEMSWADILKGQRVSLSVASTAPV